MLVTFEDYERTKRHPDEWGIATQAHIRVSRAITAYADDQTSGNRGELLRAIHDYADLHALAAADEVRDKLLQRDPPIENIGAYRAGINALHAAITSAHLGKGRD